MITLTKQTFIDEHLSQLDLSDVPYPPKALTNTLIDIFVQPLLHLQPVHLPKSGRIRVLKKAPRRGSNLGKGGVSKGSVISPRYEVRIVTSSSVQKPTSKSYKKQAFIADLKKLGLSRVTANNLATAWYAFLDRALKQEGVRIEIRGLGAFSCKAVEAGTMRRNPSSGEQVAMKATKRRGQFRISKLLMERIYTTSPIEVQS